MSIAIICINSDKIQPVSHFSSQTGFSLEPLFLRLSASEKTFHETVIMRKI
jgi:hypothetical protein